MSTLITPTTELEAVNECLANVGEAPVNSISGTIGVDAETALNRVRAVTRELQSEGWAWNTEEEYPLTPNSEGDILLPANTLSVDPVDPKSSLVQRGRRLYDKKNHTYSFDDEVEVTLIVGLPFEDLPETARRYIALRSARIFQDRLEGRADSEDTQDETMAYAKLQADQMRIEDNNALADNWSTFRTIGRRHA